MKLILIGIGCLKFYSSHVCFVIFFGRPAALLIPINSDHKLFGFTLFRLAFVPFYFIAAEEYWGSPTHDALMIGFVAFFSSTSGYIVTTSFQIAPNFLPEGSSQSTLTRQASLLNVFLAASINWGGYWHCGC